MEKATVTNMQHNSADRTAALLVGVPASFLMVLAGLFMPALLPALMLAAIGLAVIARPLLKMAGVTLRRADFLIQRVHSIAVPVPRIVSGLNIFAPALTVDAGAAARTSPHRPGAPSALA